MTKQTARVRSAKELAAEYADPDWQERFVDFCDLVEILAECVIGNDYTIPDVLNDALVLTKEGNLLRDKLHRKEGVPLKEAKLMCALTVGHVDLLVDVMASDLVAMKEAIQKQIHSNDLRFPFIHGRDLYDGYAQTFDDEKDHLTLDETFNLLDKLPTGVFQHGKYVVGPFGLLESGTSRTIPATRRVAAYHCSESICQTVHQTRLATSQEAAINKYRDKLHQLLDEESSQASEWWSFVRDIGGYTKAFFGDQNSGSVVSILGDGLSEQELRELLGHLIDKKGARFRPVVSAFLGSNNSSEAVATLNKAEIMQLLLLASEPLLGASIDERVRTGEIAVPLGEVRKSVTNQRYRSGAFQLRVELGHYGLRFVSADRGFASLRLRRLLRTLYLRDHESDTAELEWQLRGFDAEDLDDRLEEFFRSTDPRSALRRLVLARKTNMIAACEEVGLEGAESLDDEKLIETLLWKLGFNTSIADDPHRAFWDTHQRMTVLTQSSRISGIGDSETFRGVASNYFNHLEGLLDDTLTFSTWALLTDHAKENYPYSYEEESSRLDALSILAIAHETSGNTKEVFDYKADKNSIYTLIRGFGILSKELRRLDDMRSSYKRPDSDFPDFFGKTRLKEYAFLHTAAFLDLTDNARARLVRALERVHSALSSAQVNEVRNEYLHYRRTAPEIERMEKALEAIRDAVTGLEEVGLARMMYLPEGVTQDAWGRSRHSFLGPRGRSQLFARPSSFDWMGLPSLREPQYIVNGAVFAEPNEVLRFTRRHTSSYSEMWDAYPARRTRSQDLLPKPEDAPKHDMGIEVAG